jgi:hypothetical protein
MRIDGHCLFFGFEYKSDWLHAVAVDGWGHVVLRARFPLADGLDTNLEDGIAAPIAQMLAAFVQAHDAELAACGTSHNPPVLEALARHLGGPIRFVDLCDLERAGLPGHDPLVRSEPGRDAHQRAVLAGLAAAANGG